MHAPLLLTASRPAMPLVMSDVCRLTAPGLLPCSGPSLVPRQHTTAAVPAQTQGIRVLHSRTSCSAPALYPARLVRRRTSTSTPRSRHSSTLSSTRSRVPLSVESSSTWEVAQGGRSHEVGKRRWSKRRVGADAGLHSDPEPGDAPALQVSGSAVLLNATCMLPTQKLCCSSVALRGGSAHGQMYAQKHCSGSMGTSLMVILRTAAQQVDVQYLDEEAALGPGLLAG